MEMSAEEATFAYVEARAATVSPATVQRDAGWMNFLCAALILRGQEYFEDYSELGDSGYCAVLPASKLAEALPVLLDLATERLSDDPKEHKQYLSTLKGFYRWLGSVKVIDEHHQREVLQRLKQVEASVKTLSQAKLPKHKWDFPAKFRKGAYRWNGTAKAKTNLKTAVAEIRAVAKKEPGVAAEGATVLLEKLVPAIEGIDGSSGAIGASVRQAVEELASFVGGGVDAPGHESRVDRVFEALQEDGYGYLDRLGDVFDKVCGSREICSKWANTLYGITRNVFKTPGSFFNGTSACLSSLYGSGRHAELVELLELRTFRFWTYDQWKARSLVSQGRVEEALEFAAGYPEASGFCEALLLENGRVEDAYRRFGLQMEGGTYLNSFRNLCKRYPQIEKSRILSDLMEQTPGDEGKWFAAARWMGDLELALQLAWKGPCNPSTLMTAVKELETKRPEVAYSLACAALRGMDLGWAYELDYADVTAARLKAERLAKLLQLESDWSSFRTSFRGLLKDRPEFRN